MGSSVLLLFAGFLMQAMLKICCAALQPCVQALCTTSLAALTLRCKLLQLCWSSSVMLADEVCCVSVAPSLPWRLLQ
jgi:hypothetical protein